MDFQAVPLHCLSLLFRCECPLLSVSFAASDLVGPSGCTPFSYQIFTDDDHVESCSSEACFTLYLNQCCVSALDEIGYGLHCGCCTHCCQVTGP
jgi:hypothetical protein